MSTQEQPAGPVEGVDGTVVAYRERLHAPWSAVVRSAFVLAGSLGVAYGFPLGADRRAGRHVRSSSGGLAALLLLGTAPLVVVDDLVLRAGRARLPLRYVGRIATARRRPAPARRAAARPTRARTCAPRGWISRSVLVEVDDEDDPHPYWLISTRHGDRLAPILAAARDRHLASATPRRHGAATWQAEPDRTVSTQEGPPA